MSGSADAAPAAEAQRVLSTARLDLRWVRDEDAAFIVELMNDPDWLRFIGDRGVRTPDQARAWMDAGPRPMYARGLGLCVVALRGEGTPIGICGLLERDWLEDADVGYALLPRFRGAGYAREAAAAMVERARELGMPRLLAIVSPGNADSIRLLEGLGFSFERRARATADADEVCVYARSLGGES
ncbi:MAG TPA: GNAT family N-acetyltransferase [Longimicrobiaceae bacterium]|nr:GNAT family N-acetyltransferase [Longimicrobiaceae bacterium]